MASVAEGAQRTYNRVASRFGGEGQRRARINTLEHEVQSLNVAPGRSDALQSRQDSYPERMRSELHAHEPSRKSRMGRIMGNAKTSESKNENGMEMS
jgi:hypothetical protein